MKMKELVNAQLVDIYIQLRERRAARKAEYDNQDASDKSKQEKVEAELLRRLDEQGEEAISTTYGTAYKYVRSSCTTADGEAFFAFVKAHEAWTLMERRPSKEGVKQYKEAHAALPPGINWREDIMVGFRRAS